MSLWNQFPTYFIFLAFALFIHVEPTRTFLPRENVTMVNFSAVYNFVSGWNVKADFQDSLNRLIPVSARYTYMYVYIA